MFKFLKHNYIAPLLEKENQQLREDLRRERSAREADNNAWERRLDSKAREWQAKIDALSERLLYMAGVPVASLPSPSYQEAEGEAANATEPPILPGARSYEADLALEASEAETLQRYYQELQAGLAKELTQASVMGADEQVVSG